MPHGCVFSSALCSIIQKTFIVPSFLHTCMAPTSSSSDDESDYCETEESLSVKVNKIINECKNMEPNICDLNFPKLRSSLLKCKTVETKELNLRSSFRDDRKKVVDSFRELSSDITNFQRKLDTILDCVLSVLDNMAYWYIISRAPNAYWCPRKKSCRPNWKFKLCRGCF